MAECDVYAEATLPVYRARPSQKRHRRRRDLSTEYSVLGRYAERPTDCSLPLQRARQHLVNQLIERFDIVVCRLFDLREALHRAGELWLDARQNGAASVAAADDEIRRWRQDIIDTGDVVPGIAGQQLHLFEKLAKDILPLDLRIGLKAQQ